ncbi:hypothetical protein BJY01DRAFT_253377 [Aspergillus pseudoustus]|uniref:Uncharacterized protein n=1 Tax=Aspergillus pseudoustus TaxID=1810923 RepID=A0ABR4J0P7_9EURO
MTSIGVAIYNPTDDRDPSHWALWLRSADGKSVILQVADDKGGKGYYVAKPVYNKEPMKSTRLAEVVECGTIPTDKHAKAVVMTQTHPVDNESTTWNCQAWVMEVLEALEELKILVPIADARGELESRRQNWQ